MLFFFTAIVEAVAGAAKFGEAGGATVGADATSEFI